MLRPLLPTWENSRSARLWPGWLYDYLSSIVDCYIKRNYDFSEAAAEPQQRGEVRATTLMGLVWQSGRDS